MPQSKCAPICRRRPLQETFERTVNVNVQHSGSNPASEGRSWTRFLLKLVTRIKTGKLFKQNPHLLCLWCASIDVDLNSAIAACCKRGLLSKLLVSHTVAFQLLYFHTKMKLFSFKMVLVFVMTQFGVCNQNHLPCGVTHQSQNTSW